MDSCDEDGWKKTKMRKTTKEHDDEDNDGDIDKDSLTLSQVHLAPVSSQQSSVKNLLVPRYVVRSTKLFYLISFF